MKAQLEDLTLLRMMANTTGWPVYHVRSGSKLHYDDKGERVAKPRGNCVIVQHEDYNFIEGLGEKKLNINTNR